MNCSQFIQEKAKKLVAEHRVFQIFQGDAYAIFLVEGDTDKYQVHIREGGMSSCTCLYWTYRQRVCSHILASQLYHHPPRPEVLEKPEEGLSMEEMERIVAEAADLFDPETWR